VLGAGFTAFPPQAVPGQATSAGGGGTGAQNLAWGGEYHPVEQQQQRPMTPYAPASTYGAAPAYVGPPSYGHEGGFANGHEYSQAPGGPGPGGPGPGMPRGAWFFLGVWGEFQVPHLVKPSLVLRSAHEFRANTWEVVQRGACLGFAGSVCCCGCQVAKARA
jgi:hypothetical protein